MSTNDDKIKLEQTSQNSEIPNKNIVAPEFTIVTESFGPSKLPSSKEPKE